MILGGKFFQVSNTMFHYGLTPIQFAVYCYLVSCAGQKGKCWPRMKTIAAMCGCSVNAARAATTELECRRLIRKIRTFENDEEAGYKYQTSNTYFILELPDLKSKEKQVTYSEAPSN